MEKEHEEKRCVACDRDEEHIPLIPVRYRAMKLWICPQHLPILIHDPTRLAGRLPGAEEMEPAEHHD